MLLIGTIDLTYRPRQGDDAAPEKVCFLFGLDMKNLAMLTAITAPATGSGFPHTRLSIPHVLPVIVVTIPIVPVPGDTG